MRTWNRLSARQQVACVVPVVVALLCFGLVRGGAWEPSRLCSMWTSLQANGTPNVDASPSEQADTIAGALTEIDFGLLEREVPTDLRDDVAALRQEAPKFLEDAAHAPDVLTALTSHPEFAAHVVTVFKWVQSQCP